MENKNYRASISELDEIILNIFGFLGVSQVLKVSLVCKRWNRIANDNILWRHLVLQRWPSQRPILNRVSTLALQWQKLYRNLSDQGRYSPDDMKYFIVSKVADANLDSDELRQAVVHHMDEVTSVWEKPGNYELEETSPRFFNNNMELYYDTRALKWVFVDRRREFVDDSFTMRLNLDRMTSRQMRFIRPYQVMASCVMMYRWLVLFKQMFTEDIGLTFYRIWRFRLKHIKTGFIFETYDWKAAMSSTFSHGCPLAESFRDGGLTVLNMLSSPFFVTHPMGNNAYKIWYEITLSQDIDSEQSSRNISPSSSVENLDISKGNTEIPLKSVSHSSSLDTLGSSKSGSDEAESENGDDSEFFCNCDSFIHRSSWEYEEQQLVQAETASKWEVIHIQSKPTFEVIFDSSEEKWLFCNYCQRNPQYPEVMNRKLVEMGLDSTTKSNPGFDTPSCSPMNVQQGERSSEVVESVFGQEAIPTSLTLYRLICLFDLNSIQYRSLEDKSIWSISLQHRITRGIIQLKDLNGWLRVCVSFNEELHLYCNDLALMSLNENFGYLYESIFQSVVHMKQKDDQMVDNNNETEFGDHSKDTLVGDNSKDALVGDNSKDSLVGDHSKDSLVGDNSKDALVGDHSKDSLVGDHSKDALVGDHSKDVLVGDHSKDVLVGDHSKDVLVGDHSKDSLVGDHSKDSLVGDHSKDALVGDNSKDVLVGDHSKDVLVGDHSKDVLVGDHSKDTLVGDNSKDVLVGDHSKDSLVEDHSKDSLVGDHSKDSLVGDHSKDSLVGDHSKDSLVGDHSKDSLVGDHSKDVLVGDHSKDSKVANNVNGAQAAGDNSSQSEESEEDLGNPLERFKNDVCSLLHLVINQKFAHPYGTVAGAVA